MTIELQTLRPGFLVSLSTEVVGKNVQWFQRSIEGDHLTEDGARRAQWETTRVIQDPDEFERAKVARSASRAAVTGICTFSKFGLLCPESKLEQLIAATAESRRIADKFNSTSVLSELRVYIVTGRIAPDDNEAIRGISREVANLLATMEEGVRAGDVEAIRKAAKSAKSVAQMLTPEVAELVQETVKAVREDAREIKSAQKAGAPVQVNTETLARLESARTVFLDIEASATVAAPKAEATEIDVGAVSEEPPSDVPAVAGDDVQLDF